MNVISVRGARQHNLKNLDLNLPRNRITVITGLSGSGKSSLAFDTLYAEGQRRYIESLSTYARQFLEQMEKPDVDSIEGLSPAISIEQKTTSRNVRSTVGTITEVYDYMRLLFSSIGQSHCPNCDKPITPQTIDQIVERIFELAPASRILVLAPIVRERKGEFRKLFEKYFQEGYLRARVDGEIIHLEEPPDLDRRKNHTIEIVIDRLLVREDLRERIEAAVRLSVQMAKGLVTVAMINGPETLFSEAMACIDCGINVPTLEPRSFSFNSRFGACPNCEGLGTELRVRLDRLIVNPEASAQRLKLSVGGKDLTSLVRAVLRALLEHHEVDASLAFERYPAEVYQHLLDGFPGKLSFRYGPVAFRSEFLGLNRWFQDRLEEASSSPRRRRRGEREWTRALEVGDCRACAGSRLRPESRAVRVWGHSISDYARMSIEECRLAFARMSLNQREARIAGQILEEIQGRLEVMSSLGLGYLTLDRQAASLSGGEIQRVRLATQVGSKLRGVLYVLDEPSIGLHPRDTQRLLTSLKRLRDLGNTILIVEHDEDTIRSADHIVDLGPGAGRAGGWIVAEGSPESVLSQSESLTTQYLSGSKRIDPPSARRTGNGHYLHLKNVTHNNLRNVDLDLPLGVLITVSGVSGSGKSSLVVEVLYRALSRVLYGAHAEPGRCEALLGLEHIDKVIEIDQSPIGRTPRSNPATYTGLFTPIRELFAMLPESRLRGYRPGRFSFNVKGGRCEACQGDGLRRIEMNFLPDIYVECEACRGRRYNRETLSVRYQGYSIADVLSMTIEEAAVHLENFPRIREKLRTLMAVGLGYIHLGQSATTLSGGEAQRVKLAKELSRRSTGKTLYILDEPTTGLHFEDVRKLLDILQELVNLGNSVVVIEHNLEVVKCSDWVVDLGPEGGEDGGQIVFQGTPEDAVRCSRSHTGRALARVLQPSGN